jgi:hypothetical protein
MKTPSTGGKEVPVPIFDVSLRVPHTSSSLDLGMVPAMESVLLDQGFGVLIGRNVLSHCLLVYNGTLDVFSLAF